MSDQGNNSANLGGKDRRKKKSAKRKTSQRTGFEEDPIKTERANEGMLLGQIEFKDTSSKNGKVKLEGDLWKHMQSMWTEQKSGDRRPPDEIDIRSLKLGALNSLSRPDKRNMLRELANDRYPKETVKVKIAGVDRDFKERELSLAAVLVLDVGLHKHPEYYDAGEVSATGKTIATTIRPDTLFAELVGCADAVTIEELSHYLRPPFMTLEKLPDFIHCAVRQYV
tara:strand:+ start:16967 stop:17641 length:675 start_codon:yes stop_codon:yes gene_type:complete